MDNAIPSFGTLVETRVNGDRYFVASHDAENVYLEDALQTRKFPVPRITFWRDFEVVKII